MSEPLSPARVLADFEAGTLTRLERRGLLLQALGRGALAEFLEVIKGEALEDVLTAAREAPWTDEGWADAAVLGSWCGGEERAEEIVARIRAETRAGVEAIRAHFRIEPLA